MRKVAFFIPKFEAGSANSNYCQMANELLKRRIAVTLLFIDSLSLHKSHINASGWEHTCLVQELYPPHELTLFKVREFTDLWIFSLGAKESFLDKYQLLYTSRCGIHFINSLEAIMHLKSKYYITSNTKVFRHPETHASTDANELLDIVESVSYTHLTLPTNREV